MTSIVYASHGACAVFSGPIHDISVSVLQKEANTSREIHYEEHCDNVLAKNGQRTSHDMCPRLHQLAAADDGVLFLRGVVRVRR